MGTKKRNNLLNKKSQSSRLLVGSAYALFVLIGRLGITSQRKLA